MMKYGRPGRGRIRLHYKPSFDFRLRLTHSHSVPPKFLLSFFLESHQLQNSFHLLLLQTFGILGERETSPVNTSPPRYFYGVSPPLSEGGGNIGNIWSSPADFLDLSLGHSQTARLPDWHCYQVSLTCGLIRSCTACVDPLRDWGWLLMSSGISSSVLSPEGNIIFNSDLVNSSYDKLGVLRNAEIWTIIMMCLLILH